MDIKEISCTFGLLAFGGSSFCGTVISKICDSHVSEENTSLPVIISAQWAAHGGLASSCSTRWWGAQQWEPGSHRYACKTVMGS